MANIQTVQQLKAMTQQGTAYARRFEEVLGKKAPKFIASVVSVINGNTMLQDCDPMEILQSAMVAASLDLEIVPTLGYAAIVPYRDWKTGIVHPQFQIMYKGLVQLATRSGQYRKMNAGLIYKDEFVRYSFIEGDLEVQYVTDPLRDKDSYGNTLEDLDKAGVVGAFAYFLTNSGYEKLAYWPMEQILNHGKQYSKSFQNDIRDGKKSSLWSTNLRAMAVKTVLKNTLSKWGPLSTSMEMAIIDDQKVFTKDGGDYLDNVDSDTGEVMEEAGSTPAIAETSSAEPVPHPVVHEENADLLAELDRAWGNAR